MTLRVVGAGLGRTGTSSLKAALERLLAEDCYHMAVMWGRPPDVKAWWNLATRDVTPDWHELFDGFGATLDWPACAYWEQIAAAFPDAFVLLSTRASSDDWYRSFERTIAPILLDEEKFKQGAVRVARRVTFDTFTPHVDNAEAVKRAYDAHNAHVRATVPADRLIEWKPDDGWEPICAALGLPVPDEPFPHVNTGDDLRDLLDLTEARPVRRRPGLRKRVLRRVRRMLNLSPTHSSN